MLIVIEGCDGSGKSTLARDLVERLHRCFPDAETRLVHRGPPQQHVLTEYELEIEAYRPDGRTHLVIDRWHLGELVYGPLRRGRSQLDLGGLLHVELLLASRGAVGVYLTTLALDQAERLAARGERLDFGEFTDVKRGFEQALTSSRLRWLRFRNPTAQSQQEIVKAALGTQQRVAALGTVPRYVGPTRPDVLLVGEQQGTHPTWAQLGHTSPFVPYPGTSGNYLLRALTTDELAKIRFGIVNAFEEPARTVHEIVGRPPVVALGVPASTKLTEAGVGHRMVYHPQYWRRFHHHKLAEYAVAIRGATTL